MGSFDYERKTTIPEEGICYEVLSKLAIDRFGNVSPCVRFDPKDENILGNVNEQTLEEIWYGEKRRKLLTKHISGKRAEIPFCSRCHFWGIPRGE
jgi:radical SAM protein with 4Fe4S-binding SPASM domain